MDSSQGKFSGILGWFGTAVGLLVLDLLWLGTVARPLYNKANGHLLRPEADRLAALLFYLFYVSIVWFWAVRGQTSSVAAQRGAALGFVSYGVYELTNWAVLRDWPGWLVPLDWGWGVVLTTVAAWCGAKLSRSFA